MSDVNDPSYRALALQVPCHAINDCGDRATARARMASAVERIHRAVAGSLAFIGGDCRLVVLPEYVLTGHPLGEPVPVWADRAAVEPDGAEEAALASVAQRNGVYLAANLYETDPLFPDLYFQASVVFGPAGETVLRYRRLNSMFAPTPHDVWDRYLEAYGLDGVFPVADTPIGRLAAVASEEILFPELVRCLAVRGAEVLVHSTSEVGSPDLTPKDVARRARAIENLVYVVSANTAGIEGSPIPSASADGGSQVVDHEGRVLAVAGPGASMVANATIDLGALRRARRRPGMANLLGRNRFELYAPVYATTSFHPPNTLDGVVPERSGFAREHGRVLEQLDRDGVI